MITTLLVFGLPLAWLISRAIGLYKNYRLAQSLGIPVLITPVSWQDPWWLPIQPLLEPLTQLPLPAAWTEWITYSGLGWGFEHKYTKEAKVGPIFAIVSPRRIDFSVADPVAGAEVLAKWDTWIKHDDVFKLFNVFGVNVNTAPVPEWPRHQIGRAHV